MHSDLRKHPGPVPPPEAALVAAALAASGAAQPERWAALTGCARVQLYTAGAAPEVRGAGAGCAVVVEGQGASAAPPLPRLTLMTTLPPVLPDPGGRAALVGLLLGQAVLLRLAAGGVEWDGRAALDHAPCRSGGTGGGATAWRSGGGPGPPAAAFALGRAGRDADRPLARR